MYFCYQCSTTMFLPMFNDHVFTNVQRPCFYLFNDHVLAGGHYRQNPSSTSSGDRATYSRWMVFLLLVAGKCEHLPLCVGAHRHLSCFLLNIHSQLPLSIFFYFLIIRALLSLLPILIYRILLLSSFIVNVFILPHCQFFSSSSLIFYRWLMSLFNITSSTVMLVIIVHFYIIVVLGYRVITCGFTWYQVGFSIFFTS